MSTTTPGVRAKNPYRISLYAALQNADVEFEDVMNDSVIPACCSEGCEVEPDGKCEHGCPSVLLAMGVI